MTDTDGELKENVPKRFQYDQQQVMSAKTGSTYILQLGYR